MQAIKLPILIYKPSFRRLKGNISIDCENISFGMIQLGVPIVSIYPYSGIMIQNHGGTICFKGKCKIGSASAISVGEKGYIEFGDKFTATAVFKIVSYHKIIFKSHVLCGWECLFTDTDFHTLINQDQNITDKGYDDILIGYNNWFALKNTILKGTKTPDNCVIASNSLLNKSYIEKKVENYY